jgi:hypothetical protein
MIFLSGKPRQIFRTSILIRLIHSAHKPFLFLFIAILCIQNPTVIAQDRPPVDPKTGKPHSISKAAIYSAVLPGLGQAYNRKVWKIPIIYAGFGVLTYFIISNNNYYQDYKEAYVYTANGETYPTDNPYVGKYDLTQLQSGMDFYRRNRDLSYIITGLWYTLNILEAYVDAHFFDYDISEDLSLHISPSVQSTYYPESKAAGGISISINF